MVLVLVAAGCMNADKDSFYVFSQYDSFNEGLHDWKVDFADYPVNDSAFYELQYAHANLPEDLGEGKALMVSGNNHSDDLFMFIKKKIRYLKPNTEYAISFEIEFATNATGDVGVGGSPGASVFLKAGAHAAEPLKVNVDEYYQMNIDKGNQSVGGSDMVVIGNIVTPQSDGYAYQSRNNTTTFIARTNSQGELWVIVGTDSGFEGTTTLYYTRINIVLSISE